MARFKSRGIRVATKVQEKGIKEMASRIKKNPVMVLPECSNKNCKKCRFKNLRTKLEKMKADEKKLMKYASRKDLSGAVAGTILLADSKISYFAAKEINGNTYVYAKRGKANDEKLLAVQNFDNPHIRMLGIMDIASRKKIYIYSIQDKMICMGNDATPPEEFIRFVTKKIGLEKGMCKHADSKKTCIRIKWIPADMELKICEDCASGNTIMKMAKYFYSPNIKKEFEATVVGNFISCSKKCDRCIIEDALKKEMDDSYYVEGKIDDKEFIENWYKKVQWNIEKLHDRVFVIDNVCYGSDADAAIEHIKPNKWEELGIEYILNRIGKPLVISNATPNKILSKYWDEYGEDVVRNIAGKEGMKILENYAGKQPSEILKRVYGEKEKQKILRELPHYKKLPPLAEFADRIARAYRTGGYKEAIKEIHGEEMDVKKKAIAYAFLLAINKAGSEEWKYSEMEKDFGSHLTKYARRLLEKRGEEYGRVLQEMLTMTGSTKKLED
ncbi:MAG: hypothetical protein U9O96_01495 [Candidatus Thermoplasmatota archaeon]|nr:hypothetical protein [Candidatus Thermoplasmatota archaeon]